MIDILQQETRVPFTPEEGGTIRRHEGSPLQRRRFRTSFPASGTVGIHGKNLPVNSAISRDGGRQTSGSATQGRRFSGGTTNEFEDTAGVVNVMREQLPDRLSEAPCRKRMFRIRAPATGQIGMLPRRRHPSRPKWRKRQGWAQAGNAAPHPAKESAAVELGGTFEARGRQAWIPLASPGKCRSRRSRIPGRRRAR